MSKFGILSITLLVWTGAAFGQQAQTKGESSSAKKQTTTKAAAKDTLPPGVPKDAVEIEPFYWRATDKDGVVWIYHTTPFGIVKDKARPDEITGNVVREAPTPGELIVVDKGAEIQFTRPTPFGPSVWTAKKTRLNEEETQAWAKYQAKAAEAAQSQKQGQ